MTAVPRVRELVPREGFTYRDRALRDRRFHVERVELHAAFGYTFSAARPARREPYAIGLVAFPDLWERDA